jgi:hypothetical protein
MPGKINGVISYNFSLSPISSIVLLTAVICLVPFFLRSVRRLLVTASVVPSSPVLGISS